MVHVLQRLTIGAEVIARLVALVRIEAAYLEKANKTATHRHPHKRICPLIDVTNVEVRKELGSCCSRNLTQEM